MRPCWQCRARRRPAPTYHRTCRRGRPRAAGRRSCPASPGKHAYSETVTLQRLRDGSGGYTYQVPRFKSSSSEDEDDLWAVVRVAFFEVIAGSKGAGLQVSRWGLDAIDGGGGGDGRAEDESGEDVTEPHDDDWGGMAGGTQYLVLECHKSWLRRKRASE